MRILLVFCHPATDSFLHTILEELVPRLRTDGHTVRTIDLYGEGFDPVLDAAGWRAHRRNEPYDSGLSEHIDALRETDALILIYPSWWYGPPAMLKGWIDRVCRPGVAFTVENGRFRTRYLAGLKRFAVITTYGSPGWFIERIVGDPGRRQMMRGLALQFARGVRTCWRPIYGADTRSREHLALARGKTIARVARLFASR